MGRGYSAYRERHGKSRKLLKILKFLVFVFLIYTVITTFLVASYIMDSSGMEPSIKRGQRLLASPAVFGSNIAGTSIKIPGFRSPERGDVVVLSIGNNPFIKTAVDSIIRFFTFQRYSLFNKYNSSWRNPVNVKRIIGIPGDSIKMENYTVLIRPSGSTEYIRENKLIKKRYAVNKTAVPDSSGIAHPFSGFMKNIVLKENEYFVLNDNRADTNDSRFFGPVDKEAVKALVFIAYIPGIAFK